MKVKEAEIKQTITKINNAADTLSRIDVWLPRSIHESIDHALNGHYNTLDHVDIKRLGKEREERENRQTEINSLRDQADEARKQTKEIARQTKYILITVIIAVAGLLFNVIMQFDNSLSNVIKKAFGSRHSPLPLCREELIRPLLEK